MKLQEFNKELSDIKTHYQKSIVTIIGNKLKDIEEVQELKQLIPSLEFIEFFHDWSGFNDGDPEYPICYHPFENFRWNLYDMNAEDIELCELNNIYSEYIDGESMHYTQENLNDLKRLDEDQIKRIDEIMSQLVTLLEDFVFLITDVGEHVKFNIL